MNVHALHFIRQSLAFTIAPLLLALLLWSPFSEAHLGGDFPGDGFQIGDPCGYITGSAPMYGTSFISIESPSHGDELCITTEGAFYEDPLDDHYRESYVEWMPDVSDGDALFSVDFTPNVAPQYLPTVDMETGYWSGNAKLIGRTITLDEADSWVNLDWTCTAQISSDLAAIGDTCDDWRLRTDPETGYTTGAAWVPYYDEWMVFGYGDGAHGSVYWEEPVGTVQVIVDILANDTQNGPNDVDMTNAPVADGYSYWRVRVRFLDAFTGEYLDETQIRHVALDIVSEDEADDVYDDALERMDYGDALGVRMNSLNSTSFGGVRAIVEEHHHPALNNCQADALPAVERCLLVEDGITGYNIFVSSGAPTSNMIGVVNSSGTAVEELSDREGCIEFYDDDTSEPCPVGAAAYPAKEDVYYNRQDDINQYIMENLTMELRFHDGYEYEVLTYDNTASGGDGLFLVADNMPDYIEYSYVPAENQQELSWRPRIKMREFQLLEGGGDPEGTTLISTDPSADLSLSVDAKVLPPSDQIRDALFYGGGLTFTERFWGGENLYMGYTISTMLDEETDPALTQQIMLLDTDADGLGDVHYYADTVPDPTNFIAFIDRLETNSFYTEGYGVVYDETVPGPIVFPTIEQYICDEITNYRFDRDSCYFGGYLPVQDLHQDPEDMLVIGTIHSGLDSAGFFEDSDDLTILGAKNTNQLRNKMFALISRYTLGQSGAGGTLDSSMEPTFGSDFVSLLGDRLLYAEGDVIISGSNNFLSKTLVVSGGDVYIDGDITGDTLGLIVLSEGGEGGNVYVDPSVRNIYANIFADGSLFSDSGDIDGDGYPLWASDKERIQALDAELYLRGSLISSNTVNGYADPFAGSWEDGSGGITADANHAREVDLNLIRQARYCYELDPITGAIDTSTTVFCADGGDSQLSDYHDGRTVPMQSFVVEYAPPPGSLPIFTSEPGSFN